MSARDDDRRDPDRDADRDPDRDAGPELGRDAEHDASSHAPGAEPGRPARLEVLERNLALLLTRAYEPALPSDAFRARLRERIAHDTARAPGAGPRPAPVRASATARPRAVGPARWLPLAAALLVAFGAALAIGAWLRASRGARSVDEILAHGEHAWRERAGERTSNDRTWNAAPVDGRGFEHPGGTLELAATERHGDWRVWLASDGVATLAPGARATIAFATKAASGRDAESTSTGSSVALDAALERGALTVERLSASSASGPWRIATSQGLFELERGTLELSYAGPRLGDGTQSVRARLADGAATLAAVSSTNSGARDALPLDTAVTVRGGRIVDALALRTNASGDGRDVVSALTNPASERSGAGTQSPNASGSNTGAAGEDGAATSDALARLSIRLALPDGARPTGPWTATVLPVLRLPAVGAPVTRVFEPSSSVGENGEFPGCAWELGAGAYELFVCAPGRATWRTSDLALAAGERIEIVATLDVPARALGRVVDARSGAPIAGAFVLSETDLPSTIAPFDFDSESDDDAWRSWSALTRTDDDGRFELPALSAGRHVLRASAPGFGAAWSGMLDIAAGSTNEIELRLAPGGSIRGHVRDELGRARVNRRVIASHIDLRAPRRCISYGLAQTDAEGAFSISDLTSGAYMVLEIDRDARPRGRQVAVRAPEATIVELGEQPGSVLRLRALDVNGSPLADIDLSVQPEGSPPGEERTWQSDRTDAEGYASFPGFAPGRYEVVAGREMGSQIAMVGVVELAAVPVDTHELRLPAGTIGGVVTANGAPAPRGCAVLLSRREGDRWEFGGRAITDANGRWSLDFVPAGHWRATAYASTGRWAPTAAEPIELPSSTGETRERATIDIDLRPGASLRILVRDSAGKPLPRVELEFVDANGESSSFSEVDRTDARGAREIPGIAPGRWIVRGKREGFAPVEATIDLEAGAQGELELVMRPTGTEPK